MTTIKKIIKRRVQSGIRSKRCLADYSMWIPETLVVRLTIEGMVRRFEKISNLIILEEDKDYCFNRH